LPMEFVPTSDLQSLGDWADGEQGKKPMCLEAEESWMKIWETSLPAPSSGLGG
jgi:hypothetical protein